MPIRIGLIDDHRIFREALQLELQRVSDIVIVGGRPMLQRPWC